MTNIIVVLPKLEEAKGVKSILVRSGFPGHGYLYYGYPGDQPGGRTE